MPIPYANTSSGLKARGEIQKILQNFKCDSVGFMDDFTTHTLILAFTWNGRQIQLKASAQGWANAYIKENPWSEARHSTKEEWERKALKQGLIAVNSILRDWVKGQVTAIETGILTFEAVFMPYTLLPSGKTLLDHVKQETNLLEFQK